MKFWEMVLICRDPKDDEPLGRILNQPQWQTYLGWYQDYETHVRQQHREILDAIVPNELADEVMGQCTLRFFIRDSHLRRARTASDLENSLSALDTFRRYGGEVMEDTLEKGSYRVESTQS